MQNPMLKFTIGAGIVTLIFTTTSFGQSFFGSTLQSSSNSNTNQQKQSQFQPQQSQTMSPSNFQSGVKQRAKQTEAQVAAKLNQGLIKPPPPPTFEPLPPLNGDTPVTTTKNGEKPAAKTLPKRYERPATTVIAPQQRVIAPPPAQQKPAEKAPQQRDTYTGFGSGTQPQGSSNSGSSSSSSDGGWDITY